MIIMLMTTQANALVFVIVECGRRDLIWIYANIDLIARLEENKWDVSLFYTAEMHKLEAGYQAKEATYSKAECREHVTQSQMEVRKWTERERECERMKCRRCAAWGRMDLLFALALTLFQLVHSCIQAKLNLTLCLRKIISLVVIFAIGTKIIYPQSVSFIEYIRKQKSRTQLENQWELFSSFCPQFTQFYAVWFATLHISA